MGARNPKADRLRDIAATDVFAVFQNRNRPRHTNDPVNAPRREPDPLCRLVQKRPPFLVRRRDLFLQCSGEVGIRAHAIHFGKLLHLHVPRPRNAPSHDG